VLFGFDLGASLQAQSAWQGELASALQYLLPASQPNLVPGDLYAVKSHIVNEAQGVTLRVATTLPQDAVALGSSPAGTFDSSLSAMVWNLGLPSGQSTDR
jgi:hypothetical protein